MPVSPRNEFEQALERYEVLQEIFNSIQDGILVVDEDENIVFANASAGRLLGVKREKLKKIRAEDLPVTMYSRGGKEMPEEDRPFAVSLRSNPLGRPQQVILKRPDGSTLTPAADDPALHLLQQVRDEAHRFAITGHRQRRGKPRKGSRLEEIPGVGPRRRKALLTHFGGLGQLRNASIEAIEAVPGISRGMAVDIYAWLHGCVCPVFLPAWRPGDATGASFPLQSRHFSDRSRIGMPHGCRTSPHDIAQYHDAGEAVGDSGVSGGVLSAVRLE